MVTIDIETASISKSCRFFALHSGQSREFQDKFLLSGKVFLDLPAFDIPAGGVGSDRMIKARAARSKQIASWLRRRGEKGEPPSRNIQAYLGFRNGRAISAMVGNIRRLYGEVREGDYLIVPGEGLFSSVMIGVVLSNEIEYIKIEKYENEDIPARSIRWISSPQRTTLSYSLSKSLSRPLSITQITDRKLQAEILQHAYGNFIFGDESKQYFPGESYNDQPNAPTHGLTLISACIAIANSAYSSIESGETSEILSKSIPELAESDFSYFEIEQFEIAFASPGGCRLWARRAAVAITVSAIIAVTAAGIPYEQASAAEIVNSIPADKGDQECMIKAQSTYSTAMAQMGLERYNELCKRNKKAQSSVGLKSGASVATSTQKSQGKSPSVRSRGD